LDVQNKIAEQEKKKQEFKEEMDRDKEEKEAAGEEFKEPDQKWEVFKEDKYQTKNVMYFLCMDTLGQDREFTDKEKDFVKGIVKEIVQSWEEMEIKILTHDKEMRAASKKKILETAEKEKNDMAENIEKVVEDKLGEEAKYK